MHPYGTTASGAHYGLSRGPPRRTVPPLSASYIPLVVWPSKQGVPNMSLGLQDRQALRSALRPILQEAREEDTRDNPAGARHPFFHPVIVTLADGQRVSAFSRDLSAQGVGMLHSEKLPLEEVDLSIATGRGYVVKVRTMVIWCKPCSDDMYVSGGHFISVPAIGEEPIDE